MGLFRKILRRDVAEIPQQPEETLGKGDVLPAEAPSAIDNMKAGANVALDKATDLYRKNPKLVIAGLAATIAAAGGAIAYAAIKRRRPGAEA